MLVFGLNTSGPLASIAVAEQGRMLACTESPSRASHAEKLAGLTEKCLKDAGIGLSEIGLIGAVVGPGSFTGLRIGISFLMGLFFGKNVPVVPLSSLEVLAFCHGAQGEIIRPVLDAGRGEVYTGLYCAAGSGMACLEEDRIETLDNLAGRPGEKRVGVISKEGPALPDENRIMTDGFAAALLAQHHVSRRTETGLLRPVYMRKSAAEERWKGNAVPN